MNKFSDMVRNLCRLKGLQLGELAQKMNIRQTSLSQLLAKGKPRPSTFKKLATALGVREEDLHELYLFPENYVVSARPIILDSSTTDYDLVIEELDLPIRPSNEGSVRYAQDSATPPPPIYCSASATNRSERGGERVRVLKEPTCEEYVDEETGKTIRITKSTNIRAAKRSPLEKRPKAAPTITDTESDRMMSSHIAETVGARFWVNGKTLIAPSLQAIKEITNLLSSLEGMDARRQSSVIKLLFKEYGEE